MEWEAGLQKKPIDVVAYGMDMTDNAFYLQKFINRVYSRVDEYTDNHFYSLLLSHTYADMKTHLGISTERLYHMTNKVIVLSVIYKMFPRHTDLCSKSAYLFT